MIIIACELCGSYLNEITTESGIETVPVENVICKKCEKRNLEEEWDQSLSDLDKEWNKIEAERRKFLELNLKRLKDEFFMEKKKKFFGPHYKGDKK